MGIGDARLQAEMERDALEREFGADWVALGEALNHIAKARDTLNTVGARVAGRAAHETLSAAEYAGEAAACVAGAMGMVIPAKVASDA